VPFIEPEGPMKVRIEQDESNPYSHHIYFHIILPSMLLASKWSLLFGFSTAAFYVDQIICVKMNPFLLYENIFFSIFCEQQKAKRTSKCS
jgi:hypothetical protein